MPYLKKIVVQDFRNIVLQELEFSPKINCISGNNGEGKTNLLDAIYYLSMTKSAFSSGDKFNFRYGSGSFSIAGSYASDSELESRFSIQVREGEEKKLRRDDKAYTKISDHIGVLPVVMVSPYDVSMVSESGEERRKFVNAVLSQMDREYLHNLQQYNRLLVQRNKLLKENSSEEELMEIFDARMSDFAAPIFEKRLNFTQNLVPIVREYYRLISGGQEEVSIEYRSDLFKADLADLLLSCREKDKMLRYTCAGIQRDDFVFLMNGHPIRNCGSQGQQKSFLVALKFAQYELMRKCYGSYPILLLDDLFDKLDMERTAKLLRMVSGSDFGQIFLSDSNKVRLRSIVDGLTEDRSYFDVAGGVFTKMTD